MGRRNRARRCRRTGTSASNGDYPWVEGLPKVGYLVASGNPFEQILDAAEDQRIDLIVLATHGRTGVKRLLIGNVAEKVVRHAHCPVPTVKPRAVNRRTKVTAAN